MADRDDVWIELGGTLQGDVGFVLATVVSTSSSAPRPAGTQMAILDDGTVVGSLSGGCVEGDVYARAELVASTGKPHLQDYGYSDGTAFDVGLTCGGSIRVYLERIEPEDFGLYRTVLAGIEATEPLATITAISGPDVGWRTTVDRDGDGRADLSAECSSVTEVEQRASALLREHKSGLLTIPAGAREREDADYFVRSFGEPAQMVIFGANAFATALAKLAKLVGYYVTVCDARESFITPERFPDADQLKIQWPHEYLAQLSINHRTVLCVLTHDPKFDDPLLQTALGSSAGFIGAMGSRRTTEERYKRLRKSGVDEAGLKRLHAPLGLDLGASTPEETAVSMMAEIISTREYGSNEPLGSLHGPIHSSTVPVRE